MARYRLRFHLQEVDLQRGATYIGRSEECEVTIEDPLVSRKHARILFEGDDDVSIEDLGSRNGVRVNARPIEGSQKLVNGDRVRIGTQDFVFSRVQPKVDRQGTTTGVLRLCSQCKAPYAREAVSCPNCGATEAIEATDEDTLSGGFGAGSQYAWSVQLLVEALDKAMGLGKFSDAERILRRASALLEERVASGGKVLPMQLLPLAVAAERLSKETRDPTWGVWMADFCVRADLFPPEEVTEQLIAMRLQYRAMEESVGKLLSHFHGSEGVSSREDREALHRLLVVHGRGGDETSGERAALPRAN